jgi:hypothetical protein
VSKNTNNGSKQKKSLQRRRYDRQAEELKGSSWLMFHPLLSGPNEKYFLEEYKRKLVEKLC